jgi:hypothetical protein
MATQLQRRQAEKCTWGVGRKTRNRKLGGLGKLYADRSIILKWVLEKQDGGLAQDTNQWRALVNTLMNLWLLKMLGNS